MNSKKGAPLFSVVIPAYNHENYIGPAVESVLDQSLPDFELIIINDGSRDGTEKVINRFDDNRIRYYVQENAGAHNTINRGISLAEGEFIAILNSDDIFKETRLDKAFHIFNENPEIMAVFSHVELIDSKDNPSGCQTGPFHELAVDSPLVLQLLSGNHLLTTSNLIVRKTVFDTMEPFRPLKYTHDYDFFLRLSHKFDVKIIKEPLVRYRIHKENTLNKYKSAEIDFEVGVVLSDFLLNHDLEKYLLKEDLYGAMGELFTILDTYRSDRVMLVQLIYSRFGHGKKRYFFNDLVRDRENPFKKSCLAFLEERTEWWWKDQAEAWKEQTENWKARARSWEKTAGLYKDKIAALETELDETKQGAAYLEEQRDAWQDTAGEFKAGNAYLLETKEQLEDRLVGLYEELSHCWRRIETIKNQRYILKAGGRILPRHIQSVLEEDTGEQAKEQ